MTHQHHEVQITLTTDVSVNLTWAEWDYLLRCLRLQDWPSVSAIPPEGRSLEAKLLTIDLWHRAMGVER